MQRCLRFINISTKLSKHKRKQEIGTAKCIALHFMNGWQIAIAFLICLYYTTEAVCAVLVC